MTQYIYYRLDDGWYWIDSEALPTDEKVDLKLIYGPRTWEAREGYYFKCIKGAYDDQEEEDCGDGDSYPLQVEIDAEHPMTDWVEAPIPANTYIMKGARKHEPRSADEDLHFIYGEEV